MKEAIIKLIECGKEVGCVTIPDCRSNYWSNTKELRCPCNYIREEKGVLFVQGRNCSCANDCYWNDRELNESCDFQGREIRLPVGSIVEFYED